MAEARTSAHRCPVLGAVEAEGGAALLIRNRDSKIDQVVSIITQRIAQINQVYRRGPSLHFYRRVRELRFKHASIDAFLAQHECIEILYATLVAWDMDGRGAKMKDFDACWRSLRDCLPQFHEVEATIPSFTWRNNQDAIEALAPLYDSLGLMRTKGRLVSVSKVCHFLFPGICMPMDRTNTLQKICGSTGELQTRFKELLEFSHAVLARIESPQQYLDNQWNTSEPKLVDNAIILW